MFVQPFYNSIELKKTKCSICGSTPIMKSSDHLFFELEPLRSFLLKIIPNLVDKSIYNKLSEWLNGELKPWDISRESPYFGFEIPNYPNKYFYVWLDAPIGYIASSMDSDLKRAQEIKNWWKSDNTEIYHFIGKDIVYFHTLFWPAMLHAAEYKIPNKIFVHGFLTFNGEKMSKSKGTFIKASTYFKHLNPLYSQILFCFKIKFRAYGY